MPDLSNQLPPVNQLNPSDLAIPTSISRRTEEAEMNGKTFPSTLEPSFLIECIREWYHAQVVSLHRLPSDSEKYIYQVKLSSGAIWVLRVIEDASKATFVELAHLLLFFEQQHYPAERIVFTNEQTSIVNVSNWHLLMTTYLVGTPLEYVPPTFSLLGTAVGKLHALQSSLTYVPSPASMLPSGELAFAQQQLETIASRVPRPYIAQYELLENALVSIDRGASLPTTLIHNDCHPGNALLTAPEQVILFDWEGAGMGSAALDVGFLLVSCDGKAPWEPLSTSAFHLDEKLLQAVIEGYCHYHQLTTDELNYLPDAIRFRSLVFGACSFASAIAHQESAEFSQWWWKRYCAAEEIADQARISFEHLLQ